jgi:hypothetical protein
VTLLRICWFLEGLNLMNQAKKAEFNRREPGPIPVVVASRCPGQAAKAEIEAGDSVTLHIGSERVLVNEVEVFGNGKFRGRIHGFEPSHRVDYEGHKLEDLVDFEHLHVYALG